MLKYGDYLFELCNEQPSYLLPHEAHISFVSTINIFVNELVVFVAEFNNLHILRAEGARVSAIISEDGHAERLREEIGQ